VKGWRRNSFFTFSWGYPHLRRWLASQLSSREKSILSVGCGSGELERDLTKLQHRVIGIDHAHRMLELALRKGFKCAIQADASFLPFRARYFDVVMFPESIGYLDIAMALREAHRVLKRQGRIIITAYPTHMASDSCYKKNDLANIVARLSHAGFHVLDAKLLKVNTRNIREVALEESSNLLFLSGRKATHPAGPL
jgi:ubiquinone/menaquinone biosynthesis C-methylase UbiE